MTEMNQMRLLSFPRGNVIRVNPFIRLRLIALNCRLVTIYCISSITIHPRRSQMSKSNLISPSNRHSLTPYAFVFFHNRQHSYEYNHETPS